MSDGNFNRQLLPKTELASGLRAGRAQMRQKAEKSFNQLINNELNELSEEKKEILRKHFMEMLR